MKWGNSSAVPLAHGILKHKLGFGEKRLLNHAVVQLPSAAINKQKTNKGDRSARSKKAESKQEKTI